MPHRIFIFLVVLVIALGFAIFVFVSDIGIRIASIPLQKNTTFPRPLVNVPSPSLDISTWKQWQYSWDGSSASVSFFYPSEWEARLGDQDDGGTVQIGFNLTTGFKSTTDSGASFTVFLSGSDAVSSSVDNSIAPPDALAQNRIQWLTEKAGMHLIGKELVGNRSGTRLRNAEGQQLKTEVIVTTSQHTYIITDIRQDGNGDKLFELFLGTFYFSD